MEADDQARWALQDAEPHDMHISWWPDFMQSDVAEVLKKAVGTTKTRLLFHISRAAYARVPRPVTPRSLLLMSFPHHYSPPNN